MSEPLSTDINSLFDVKTQKSMELTSLDRAAAIGFLLLSAASLIILGTAAYLHFA